MAELLVYNTTHWWDQLSTGKQDAFSDYDRKRFQGVYKKGDVIEVRDDGHYIHEGKIRNCDLNSFCVVKVSGKSSEYEYLREKNQEKINGKLYTRQRKRNVDPAILISDINEVSTLVIEEKSTSWQPS
jgi:hypothetical protein